MLNMTTLSIYSKCSPIYLMFQNVSDFQYINLGLKNQHFKPYEVNFKNSYFNKQHPRDFMYQMDFYDDCPQSMKITELLFYIKFFTSKFGSRAKWSFWCTPIYSTVHEIVHCESYLLVREIFMYFEVIWIVHVSSHSIFP